MRLSQQNPAGLSDGQLLDRVVSARDEAAFECLVWRHGPMVLGVCRRLLRNPADADDAFQATFLVLFRKAAVVRPRERVGAWLHGVAVRAATKLYIANARRVTREQSAARPEVAPQPVEPDPELSAALDRELARLPERYRVPLVLCDLQGQSIKETAERLGWRQGTLASRLARGRALLARRVRATGLASLGAVAFASETVSAARVRDVLLAVAATRSAGPQSAAHAVAASVLQSLWVAKMKSLVAVVAAAAVVALGAWGAFTVTRSADPERTIPAEQPVTAVPALVDGEKPVAPPPAEVKVAPAKDSWRPLGRWRLLREERGGKVVPKSGFGALVVSDGVVGFFDETTGTPDIRALETTRPTDKPGHFDLTVYAKGYAFPSLGIYELRGDRLRVCMGVLAENAGPPEHKRPTEFKTTAGGTAILWEFEREEIAWGPPAEGIKLGLVVSPAASRVGETVTFRLFAANTTEKDIEFESPNMDVHYEFNRPVLLDPAGRRAGMWMRLAKGAMPSLVYTKRTLRNAGVVEIGSAAWTIRDSRWKDPDVDPAHPFVRAKPGAYTVQFKGIKLKGKPERDTGTLALKVGRADEPHTDSSGIAWGAAEGGLQLGVSYAPGSGPEFRVGERFFLHVHLRNVTEKPIEYTLVDKPSGVLFNFLSVPHVADTALVAGKAYMLKVDLIAHKGDVGSTKYALAAGEVRVIGRPSFCVGPATKYAPDLQIEARPGVYNLWYPGVVINEKWKNDTYPSGSLRFVIRDEK
jgi:RNA polymerase sigma factor (sigma-70 family)